MAPKQKKLMRRCRYHKWTADNRCHYCHRKYLTDINSCFVPEFRLLMQIFGEGRILTVPRRKYKRSNK